jgi:hypothetical protein
MRSGGAALAAAGLALVLGAAQAAAAIAVDQPTVTEILASCVQDEGYSVTGTVQVVYPTETYYDAYVQLEVFARSVSSSTWVATGATWGVTPTAYLPDTGPVVNQPYDTLQLADSYADTSQYDELQVQAIGGNTSMQWSGAASSWFTCGATSPTAPPTATSTPTPTATATATATAKATATATPTATPTATATATATATPTPTPAPSPTGQVLALSTPGTGAGAPSGPAGLVGLAVLLAGGMLILVSLPQVRRRDDI